MQHRDRALPLRRSKPGSARNASATTMSAAVMTGSMGWDWTRTTASQSKSSQKVDKETSASRRTRDNEGALSSG